MKKLITIFSLVVATLPVAAQQFTIKAIETTVDHNIVIHYDLIDTTKSRLYSVFVYSSVDNFIKPLTKLSGDAGIEVRPGNGKKIVWRSKDELPSTFNGEVELEVRGRVFVPFIRFEGFQDVLVRKRETPFTVKWSGGSRQNILNFQLYRRIEGQDILAHTYQNVPNTSEYTLRIPRSVKPGDNYFFRISDTKNSDQVVTTPVFTVKRKISLGVKAAVVIGVGALVYLSLPDAAPTTRSVVTPPNPPKE